VIVPVTNLTGPGGIDRLPEPLRRELQILEFDQWKGSHEPFDPERHRLQVVAVDHILEAFEIARVDDAELAAVERICVDHARGVVPLLTPEQPCPMAVLVKDPEEIDEESFQPALCRGCAGCNLLVPEGTAGHWSNLLPSEVRRPRTFEVETGAKGLEAALREAAAELPPGDSPMVVVAPYFALRELGCESLSLARPVVFFANNYLAQGYKLGGIKGVFNHTVCRLLHVGRPALDTFPLLGRKDGVFVPDLGLVPEKYRLDPGRCEILLRRFLTAWINVVDGAVAAGSTDPGSSHR
jgi:ATP-dependent Lon protease